MQTLKLLVQWLVDVETLVQKKDRLLAERDARITKQDSIIAGLRKELEDAKPASE